MAADPAPSPSAAPALDLEDVTVQFGGLAAVSAVSLSVAKGQRVAVIGPNGAGKTTLFKTVSGEQIPTSGTIRLFGETITGLPPHRRARLGIGRTYQVTNLFGELTVEENVLLAAQGLSRTRLVSWAPIRRRGGFREQVGWALDQVELSGRSRIVAELSHGEQRQLELAMGIVGRPRVLLLDEPAAGLSASERVVMRRLIEGLDDDLALVLIEHDMNLALELVHDVVVLDNGEVIARGAPDDIREDPVVQDVYLKND